MQPRRKQKRKQKGERGRKHLIIINTQDYKPVEQSLPRNLICPDSYTTNLEFVYTASLNNAGSPQALYRFQPTGAFDVDPSYGGTATPGFTEWAAFYNYYRVLSYRCSFEIESGETFGVNCMQGPLNQDPTNTPSAGVVSSLMSAPYWQVKNLSAKGGMDRQKIVSDIDCEKFIGSKSYLYDNDYASQVTTVPSNNIFHAVAIYSGSNNLTVGTIYRVSFIMRVKFYERLRLVN